MIALLLYVVMNQYTGVLVYISACILSSIQCSESEEDSEVDFSNTQNALDRDI